MAWTPLFINKGYKMKDYNVGHHKNMTHGETKTRLYRIWSHMKTRCYNSKHDKYRYYGGRGIIICEEWHQYLPFRKWALDNGYQPHLTIERNDVNGNYCPENCTWITQAQQAKNKRRSGMEGATFEMVRNKPKWRARVGQKSLGYFDSRELALKARSEFLNSKQSVL